MLGENEHGFFSPDRTCRSSFGCELIERPEFFPTLGMSGGAVWLVDNDKYYRYSVCVAFLAQNSQVVRYFPQIAGFCLITALFRDYEKNLLPYFHGAEVHNLIESGRYCDSCF